MEVFRVENVGTIVGYIDPQTNDRKSGP